MYRLLKLAVTQFKTSWDISENITITKAKLGSVGYELPDTIDLCQKALVNIACQLKATIQEEVEHKNL